MSRRTASKTKEKEDGDGEDAPDSGKLPVCSAVEDSTVTFDSIAGLIQEKQRIRQAFILPTKIPNMFTERERSILFYGPPGTGKTLLARALRNEFPDSIMIAPLSSDLSSSYYGQSAKLLAYYFECASKQAYAKDTEQKKERGTTIAFLFFDEFEAIARKRSPDDTEQAKGVATLLQLFDKYDNVIVVAATNKPWEMDSAVLRRLPTRVFVDVPDRLAREQIVINKLRSIYTPQKVVDDSKAPMFVKENIWKLALGHLGEFKIDIKEMVTPLDARYRNEVYPYFYQKLVKLPQPAPDVLPPLMYTEFERRVHECNRLVTLLTILSGPALSTNFRSYITKSTSYNLSFTNDIIAIYDAQRQINLSGVQPKYDTNEHAYYLCGYSASDLTAALNLAINTAAYEASERGFKRCKPLSDQCFAEWTACQKGDVGCLSIDKLPASARAVAQNFYITVTHFLDAFISYKSTVLPREYIEFLYYYSTGELPKEKTGFPSGLALPLALPLPPLPAFIG